MKRNNGHVRVQFVIPVELNRLIFRLLVAEQMKRESRVTRHTIFKEALIEAARRRRIPIPKGL
mgnify:CR=1 FL=1